MKKAAVIGWPVAHSRSPLLHGFWLNQYGINGSYEAIAIEPEHLRNGILKLAEAGYAGINVTVPHKEEAYRFAEELGVADDLARRIGAVNTMRFENGTVALATNTDCTGFIRNLKSGAPDWQPHDSDALILGAGGAARGIIVGLIDAGVTSIEIVNRTTAKAEALAAAFANEPARITVGEWQDLPGALSGTSLLINTTTLGMKGEPPLPVDVNDLPDHAIVTDIVYNPLETDLLKSARERGLTTVDGLGMLLHQAAPGFEMWFGRKPEVSQSLRTHVLSGG